MNHALKIDTVTISVNNRLDKVRKLNVNKMFRRRLASFLKAFNLSPMSRGMMVSEAGNIYIFFF